MEHFWAPDRASYRCCLETGKGRTPAVLATVVEAAGSTPQVVGASALVSAGGLLGGTVGGGVVEAGTIRAAQAALVRRRSRLLVFDLAKTYSSEADAVCGGRMRILIDAAPEANRRAFGDLLRAIASRRGGVLATYVAKRPLAIQRRWFSKSFRNWTSAGEPWVRFRREIVLAARSQAPAWLTTGGGWLYLEPHAPPPRLLIAGAGHVGRAVARQGKLLGFEVTVIDDRPELSNRAAIPEADRFLVGPIAGVLARLPLGGDAYVVIVTRGHRHDAAALRACIGRAAAYLGMIGSARKIALMRDEFLRRNWATADEWSRVRAPIGLPIGSRSVAEIAVSIAAELVAVRRDVLTHG
jgi:xanthine dehydrogenase accessory factor